MFCKNCGSEIKEGTRFCPKCGAAVKVDGRNKQTYIPSSQAIPSIASMTGPVGESGPQSASRGQNSKRVVLDAANRLQGFGEKVKETWEGFTGPGNAGKEKGNKRAWFILVTAVTVILFLGIINGEMLNNLLHKTFSSPKKYYQFVEKKMTKEIALNAGEIYDSYLLDALNFYDKSMSGKLAVELEEDGQDLLGLLGLAGVDLSWLQNVSITQDASIKDNVASAGIAVAVNKTDLLSGEVTVEKDKGKVYLRIPELSKNYLGAEIPEEKIPEEGIYADTAAYSILPIIMINNKELMEACPNHAKVKKLVNQYMDLLVECVDDVSMGKDTLSVEGVSREYTVLKVSIDSGTMQNMMETVLDAMQNDKEIKSIIINILEASDVVADADEAYDEFQESLEHTIDDLKYLSYSDEKIVMKVYVNGKGKIAGRSIQAAGMTINMLMPEKGKKFGYELSVEMYGTNIKFTGSGKKNGDKVNGVFSIKYNGASIVDVTANKFNIKDIKKGQPNGRLEVKASSKIGYLLGNVPGMAAIEDIKLTFDFDSAKKSHACKVGVIYDQQYIGSVSVSVKTGSGSKVSIPDNKKVIMVKDEDDLEEWIEGIDLTQLIASTKKIGFPSGITDMLEEADELLEDGDLDSLRSLLYYVY